MPGFAPTIVFKSGIPEPTAVPIVRSMTILGKNPTCDLVLANPFVSQQHARIDLTGDGARISDLSSKNGTYVDGVRLGNGSTELQDGSLIEFGRNEVLAVFHVADSTVTLNDSGARKPRFNDSPLVLDEAAREVRLGGTVLNPPLSKKEFDVLFLLSTKRGQVCSHLELARAGWPERESGGVEESDIRQYVRRVRNRISSAGTDDVRITTLRGSGYRLDIG